MDSILTSIKTMLGIEEDDTAFDSEIIISINSVLMILSQIGVGPSDGFFIIDDSATWKDLIGDRHDLEAIKTYVFLRVRLIFDPPATSFVLDSMQRVSEELEWRLFQKNDSLEGGDNSG